MSTSNAVFKPALAWTLWSSERPVSSGNQTAMLAVIDHHTQASRDEKAFAMTMAMQAPHPAMVAKVTL